MHLRRLEWVWCSIAFLCAASIEPGTLTGEPGRLFTTFLGLVAAGIMPTISLIVGGMVTGSRSVKLLGDLGNELEKTVSALFSVFGLIACAAFVLMLLSVPTPFIEYLPNYIRPIPTILGQGVVGFVGALVICKSGTIPGAIHRSLSLRTQIAVEEARKKTEANVADVMSNTGFETKSQFGRVTKLTDLAAPDGKDGGDKP